MINFRYHIVSLTAVFLALIIGILMGTTVVSKATVDGLRSNLQRAEARSAAVHETNRELSKSLDSRTKIDAKVDTALSENVTANAVAGTLSGIPVLVIAAEGADKDLVDEVITTLGSAGADVDGTLVFADRSVLSDADAARVRQLLGLPADADAHAGMIRRLAGALAAAALPGIPIRGVPTTVTTTVAGTPPGSEDPSATSPPVPPPAGGGPTSPTATEPDVISALRNGGFLSLRPLAGHPADAPVLTSPQLAQEIGYRYVFIPAAGPDPVGSDVLAPLIRQLASLGPVPQVAAVGPFDTSSESSGPFLTALLRLSGVKGHVSTVDNLGSFAGDVATVYALAEAGGGNFGSYGIGDSADRVTPARARTRH
ncbi:MAG: copper transporter [Actinobacteria bacterium]|nr:copper transporter [Actinomycetota bacterium]